MSAEISADVQGLREALKVLGKLDKEQRKESVKRLKAAGAPMVQVARLQYPTRPPLSGMKSSQGRLNYQPGKVRQGVTLRVGGKQPPQKDRYPVITIVQSNAAGQLFSVAGMRNNRWSRAVHDGQRQFSDKLRMRWGTPQRGMWKQAKFIRGLANSALSQAIDDVVKNAQKELNR